MKSIPKIYEFDCEIYPRKLWVVITNKAVKGFSYLHNLDQSVSACTNHTFKKKDNVGGIMIRFSSIKSLSMDEIAHESCHAAMMILDYVGATVELNNQEPFCYLVGWIAKCCEQVKKDVLNKNKSIMEVKIVNKSNHRLPEYKTVGSAGMDLKADILEPIVLNSMEKTLVPTGLHIQLPKGYEAQIRPRSGLAAKYGITVLNTPGTIDSDYTGEIKVILINLSKDTFVINPGERIAQMVISNYEHINWKEVTELSETERGEGGFGSTGVK